MEYRIVSEESEHKFKVRVNALLKEGYEFLGPLRISSEKGYTVYIREFVKNKL